VGSGQFAAAEDARQHDPPRLYHSETLLTGQLTVTAPAARNLAPQGHYLPFILSASAVPSVAKIVKIN
jgi:galactose oxidase-like protein